MSKQAKKNSSGHNRHEYLKLDFKEPEKVKSLPLMSDFELGQLIEKRRFEAMRKGIVNNPEMRCEFKREE